MSGKNANYLAISWLLPRAWPFFLRDEMTRAMPSSFHLDNGHARVTSGRTNHLALKTTLFSNLRRPKF